MDKKGLIGFLVLALIIIVIGFFWFTKNNDLVNNTNSSEIANPASSYCVSQGNKLEIKDEEGGQVGYCVSPDGQKCEEWSFYRGECLFEGRSYCVPDSCCHPSSCILSNESSSNCSDVLCTAECREGTLDCGAGHCAFVNNSCEVVWDEE